jgi:DNA-directed RNA polymerase subunit RPC12/RpoP
MKKQEMNFHCFHAIKVMAKWILIVIVNTSKNGNCGGIKMSMTAVIESIERDALRQAMKSEGLFEKRCQRCNRLLGKFNGQAEIKCPKCGKINRIGVK